MDTVRLGLVDAVHQICKTVAELRCDRQKLETGLPFRSTYYCLALMEYLKGKHPLPLRGDPFAYQQPAVWEAT